MKKSFYSLVIAVILSFGSLCANGAEATAQAIVLKIKGSPTVAFAGQSQSALKVGDKLPQGATIVTNSDSEVDIQAFNGAVATIKANSSVSLEKLSVTTSGGAVTKQTALLNLKVGKILSTIDPANHKINDYGIRTPKGVAAARGTVFTVSVAETGAVKVYVTDSAVTFYNPTTGKSVTVQPGQAITISKTGEISTPYTPTKQETSEITGGKVGGGNEGGGGGNEGGGGTTGVDPTLINGVEVSPMN